uniref:Ribosomal protein L5 n=1 Tax=Fistulifera saprophila TaxID=880757 RepID=A0A8F0WFX4_9STRA|nr:ribosomal protein L5 [Fistulifera saprophila]QWM93304.1 ribosomal protein L5 [Fistulifera saprophila]
MNFIEKFYSKTLKYDLINKFLYKNTKTIPQIEKIILNFGCKTSDLKALSTSALALELITNQKGTLTLTKHNNVLLKIRKGHPVGCKVTLRKKKSFAFLTKMLIDIFPKLKNFEGLKTSKKMKENIFSYELADTFSFQELEENYYLFNNLRNLHVTIVTTSKKKEELQFIFNSLKIPFEKK